MKWDTRKRAYVDSRGRVIPASEIRDQVNQYIKSEQEDVQGEAKKLLAGEITVAAFFSLMRQKIQVWHEVTGAIAYGGESQVTEERAARIQEKIDEEIQFLDDFEKETEDSFNAAREIAKQVAEVSDVDEAQLYDQLIDAAPSEVEDIVSEVVPEESKSSILKGALVTAGALIGGSIINRIGMYPESSYGTYANSETERERDEGIERARRTAENDSDVCDDCTAADTGGEWVPIDDVVPIGDSVCTSRCRCIIEYDVGRNDPALEGGVVTEGFV